ncbi:protein Wnt-5 [Drosophila elegans]|uniref:protein Wnt-5 n=1 Tax=Drosophila elegans TaxID=30023 RepID=UPI0007E6A0A2|nr:protein Wnt-5 [Drosophila elegans]
MNCSKNTHFLLLWLWRGICVLLLAPPQWTTHYVAVGAVGAVGTSAGVGAGAPPGLQGVPTWICLGLKSPFIEFAKQEEQLANTSIPLNITKDETVSMHQEGLRKLGTFIKPVDLRDSETGYVKADLTKRPNITSRPIHPIQEEMDQKQIILLDEDTDENGLPASLTDEDRKFIVPMALKNSSPDSRWMVTAPTPSSLPLKSTRSFVPAPMAQLEAADPTSNIDDLKKHILFLHNMTQTNSNFESKFVKFPSLQKDKDKSTTGGSPTNAKRPQRPVHQYSAPIAAPTRKVPKVDNPGQPPSGGYYQNEETGSNQSQLKPTETSVSLAGNRLKEEPQVLLLNETLSTGTTTTMSSMEPALPAQTTMNPVKGQGQGQGQGQRTTKRPPCLRNPESPKCIRQRRREEQQRQRERDEWFRGQSEYIQPPFQPFIQTINNTRRFAVSIEIPDSFKVHSSEGSDGMLLSRVERSQPVSSGSSSSISSSSISSSRKIKSDYIKVSMDNPSVTDYFKHDVVMTSADVATVNEPQNVTTNGNGNANANAYFERIDLNPSNCYAAHGLSTSQRKQCVKHTSVMPAISRGARAAIQECQFQFKNRRWNCSTTNDETVFGPMTSLAAPEMAFIYALAAATATSFIARACRDGQLASCSCSRGPRPKQLHDDWNWGGCGDNLEFAYKFATDFIDSREKETNRETRGVKRKRARDGLKKNKNRRQSDLDNLDGGGGGGGVSISYRSSSTAKARSLMNLHNNEAGRRAVIKKTRITCKCHGVSGSCSLITCWQQLSSIREIGDYLREKYEEATQVRINKRGRLQLKDLQFRVPTAHDLIYLDESPDWCRTSHMLHWPGTHGRLCQKNSSGLESCAILCCGRGYNTKNIIVKERCSCKFHWCCQVKCQVCTKVLEEHTCK